MKTAEQIVKEFFNVPKLEHLENKSELISLVQLAINETEQAIQRQAKVKPANGGQDDHQNLMELFWQYLQNIESRTKPEEDILDKIAVEDGYKLWNRLSNGKLKPRWQR
jgi:hypothetical protein